MPLLPSKELGEIFSRNLKENMEESHIQDSLEIGGSFDIGDLSHVMPVLHPLFGGVKGALHTREFSLVDADLAYVLPAKLMAMTAYDLLSNGAAAAKEVISCFKPAMTKAQYLAFQDEISKEIVEGDAP
jgi:metal-dependent amidase/aminoacylase/carboxypeptidase family protein